MKREIKTSELYPQLLNFMGLIIDMFDRGDINEAVFKELIEWILAIWKTIT
jgi:hypothetical protein